MVKLILKNIDKVFDKKTRIIKDLNLEIIDGEFLVLVGPSGCGKSTILRMIAGLEEITSGEIFIGERKVNNVHPKDRDIAMVFQNYALYPHMSVYDNMAFGLKMRKFKKEFISERVQKAAEMLNLNELLERKPKQLSGGQRQRVALGRALVREPKVFLMDEPLSNLDAKLRAQTRFEIKKLHNSLKTTFIYVTHDQVEAMTMGDRIVILDKGVIQQIGAPEEVYLSPENIFVAGFIGSPAMNFLDAEVLQDKKISFSGNIIEPGGKISEIIDQNGLTGEKVTLGIRPEYFSVNEESSLKVPLELVETLGSEKLVHFRIDNRKVVAKIPAEVHVAEDKQVGISIDSSKIFLFDPKTGHRFY